MANTFSDDATGSADRMSPRHVFEIRIRIRLQRDTQRLTLQGWSRDLSESGRGVRCSSSGTGRVGYARNPAAGLRQTGDPGESCSRIGNRVRISVHGVERCATHADSGDAEGAPVRSLSQHGTMTQSGDRGLWPWAKVPEFLNAQLQPEEQRRNREQIIDHNNKISSSGSLPAQRRVWSN